METIVVDFNELEYISEFYYLLTEIMDEEMLLHVPIPDLYVFVSEAIYDTYLLPDLCWYFSLDFEKGKFFGSGPYL